MPITYEFDAEKKIIYLTLLSELNISEFKNTFKEITESGKYPADAGILLDISSLSVPIGDAEFNANAREIRGRINERTGAKTAIFSTHDFAFGVRSKYEMLSERKPENIMIFDNFIDAEEWLIS